MKLYTEEQVLKIIQKTKMDKPETYYEVLKYYTQIELPSDEEIKDKSFNKFAQSNARTCFEEGAKWMKEQILQPNL
jgi:hypothetical protein